MRKTTAALAAAALSAATLIGPAGMAGARPAQDVPKVSCGTVGPPVCEHLATVTGLLEPLAPVLALTAPALGEVGSALSSLGQLGLSGGSVPAGDLSAAAGSMIAQLDALSGPSAALLDATGQREALRSALQQLVDALAALPVVGEKIAPAVGEVAGPVAPAPAPAPAGPAASPDSAPSSGASSGSSSGTDSTVGSTSSSAPAGFGGGLFRSSETSLSSSNRVPSVPAGSTLNLGSLGIPTFRITSPASSGVGRSESAEQGVESVVLPAAEAAASAESLPDDSRAMTVMGALSALLLAGGLLIDQVRKRRRHVIPS